MLRDVRARALFVCLYAGGWGGRWLGGLCEGGQKLLEVTPVGGLHEGRGGQLCAPSHAGIDGADVGAPAAFGLEEELTVFLGDVRGLDDVGSAADARRVRPEFADWIAEDVRRSFDEAAEAARSEGFKAGTPTAERRALRAETAGGEGEERRRGAVGLADWVKFDEAAKGVECICGPSV